MKLNLEQLNSRVMPSISVDHGIVAVTGSDLADYVNVSYDWSSSGYGNLLIQQRDSNGPVAQISINPSAVSRVVVNLAGGNDSYYNATYAVDEVHGGSGNDSLYGGSYGGALYGDAGDDFLDPGNRYYTKKIYILDGGAGYDRVQCCYGPDRITGAEYVTAFNPAEDAFF